MADTVQHYLEAMLPELDDFEKRNLFTQAEIKEILKRRREFEYLLKRRSKQKLDFLRCIEYEKKLDVLRKHRKNPMVMKLKRLDKKWTPSLCDYAIRNRIMGVYERALGRFKGDLKLWLEYLQYCKVENPKKMQKVVASCLKLHPNVPGLWIYAASWEFEHNVNMVAARGLMQTGLRMCPHAEILWVEYFRLELAFVQRLKAQKSAADGKQEREGEEKGEGDENSSEDSLSYKLADAVFRNAVEAVPSSLGLRQRFLEALDTFDFDRKAELEEVIKASMMKDFSTDESCWDWLARRHVGSQPKATQVFEGALKALPSARMYELYAEYLRDLLQIKTAVMTSGPDLQSVLKKDKAHGIVASLLQLYDRALLAQIWSEVLVKGHLEVLMRSGRLSEAMGLSRRLCGMVQLKKSASLWECRIALELKREVSANHQSEVKMTVTKLFGEALENVCIAEARPLWLMAMGFYTGQRRQSNVLVEMLEKVLARGSSGEAGGDVACALVNWIFHLQGIKRAREVYHRLLKLPGPNAKLYKSCIMIEAQDFSAGCTESFQNMRKLFDEAVELFGSDDTDLWIDYFTSELRAGNVDTASTVYWRAKKALKDPTSFIEKHQILKAS